MHKPTRTLLALGIGLTLVGATCGSSSKSSNSSATTTPMTSDITGTIVVTAASSLNNVFKQIGQDFEAAHPGAKVTYNFDSSSALMTQIQNGAPADVFASADQSNMDKVSNLTSTPVVFAKNKLEIATKPGNPKHITGLSSLATAGVIALCAEDAPCGKYAAQVLEGAHVTIPPSNITRGHNVSATLGQVSQGDAVAGIVYVTDVKGAGNDVGGVTIPDNQNAIAAYPIAVLKTTTAGATAQAFVDYVKSPAGQQTLKSFGFLAP